MEQFGLQVYFELNARAPVDAKLQRARLFLSAAPRMRNRDCAKWPAVWRSLFLFSLRPASFLYPSAVPSHSSFTVQVTSSQLISNHPHHVRSQASSICCT